MRIGALHIFVDDTRDIADVWPEANRYTTIVFRSYEALLAFILSLGLPAFSKLVVSLSLDNDMGTGYMEGREFLKRFLNMLRNYQGDDLFQGVPEFTIHSQNPIAAKAMVALVKDIEEVWKERWGQ